MDIKKVLSIAGSDPSGGAGIQADLKTFTNLGVYGAAVITCLTVQNTQKVSDAMFIPGDFVRAQLESVLEDIEITHIKTGMLGNAEIARAVGKTIEKYTVICDPVMISKSGFPLMEESAMHAVEEEVISRSTVLTPNLHELYRIAGLPAGRQTEDPIEAANSILKKHPRIQAVLVKGGHIEEAEDTVTDTLVMRELRGFRKAEFTHRRYRTENTHGTGCTLASAFTVFLAKGYALPDAAGQAIRYVTRLIEQASKNKIGKGNGPLPHHLGK